MKKALALWLLALWLLALWLLALSLMQMLYFYSLMMILCGTFDGAFVVDGVNDVLGIFDGAHVGVIDGFISEGWVGGSFILRRWR